LISPEEQGSVDVMEADEPVIVSPPVREVPVTAAQLRRLEEIAAAIAEPGFSPSVSRAADVLLSWATAQLSLDAIKQLVKDKPTGA
jgi:hypothetical protein